jgi:dihydroxy-acid dehydratase
VIKPAACDPKFHVHQGPAMVFDSYPELKLALDDENLDITGDHVLVLRNAGPQGGPGMPEWGMIPMPKALLKQGIRDMVRLSDARMSGTSFGACVLHVAPESYVGGPLALLRDGDIVRLDVPGRKLDMLVDEAELARRRAEWKQPPPKAGRGYNWMYARHIGQADTGCDFDFLQRSHGETVKEPDIF